MVIRESKASSRFTILDLHKVYNRNIGNLSEKDCSSRVLEIRRRLLTGESVLHGIPFRLGNDSEKNNILLLGENRAELVLSFPVHCRHIVFLHAADFNDPIPCDDGIFRPMQGKPVLGEKVCSYILGYNDGSSSEAAVRRRFNINEFIIDWGNAGFECVPHLKPQPLHTAADGSFSDEVKEYEWGQIQTRVIDGIGRSNPAIHWLYAMENPFPEKELTSISFVPGGGTAFIFGVTLSGLDCNPLEWESRKKARIDLIQGEELQGEESGNYLNHEFVDIDLGQVISVTPVLDYENDKWEKGYNNKLPKVLKKSVIVEYTANPNACFYLGTDGDTVIPACAFGGGKHAEFDICAIGEARIPVTVRIVEKKTGKEVPVKIHMHGRHGEYLPPINRHRIPNPSWFEDYSTDFVHDRHYCTYIDGEAQFRLPLGEVYIEVSKGFEILPVKKSFNIDENTRIITIELENILNWRENGWVTADTHVHFLSPHTALLEGEAEGINVVNLLASQWGELFTNIGDFDGKTTLGSCEAGGNGEFLVRVGTENRQHILGHISLLGYEGRMILPLTTGGPGESAIGDSVEETLSGWAERCRKQNGIAILPHHPNPRAEGAAAMVLELIDGVEMKPRGGDIYNGINPYSLSDWYRYINCGCQTAAVGGTDKMSAGTAVGAIRTYALIRNSPFTYETWKDALRNRNTFVTVGPLLEFLVNGRDMGSIIDLPKGGGTLDIDWHAASVTIPVTKIELVVNGETREVKAVDPVGGDYYGRWSVKMTESGWVALRIRGRYPDKPEIIAAHSSAVMVSVDGRRCFDIKDAATILDQIEGATAFVRSLGTKAEKEAFNRIMHTLTSAHRALHNRMHQVGVFHEHTAVDDHHSK